MAIFRIKLSQGIVDSFNAPQEQNPVFGGDLGSLVDMLAEMAQAIGEEYANFSSYSFLGTTLRLGFADGASQTYSGVQLANPNATSGKASATSEEFLIPELLSFSLGGQLNYDYTIGAQGLSLVPSAQGSTLNTVRIATHLPAASPDYDPLVGNIALALNGALNMAGGKLNGTISSITASTDRYIASSVIEGRFNLAADLDAAAQGLASSRVDGTLTAFKTSFHDGSYLNITNAQLAFDGAALFDDLLLAASAGNDDIAVELPTRLFEELTVEAGGGNDIISLAGGGGQLHAAGGAGNDIVTLLGDSHRVDGGTGLDIVRLASARAETTVTAGASSGAFSVRDQAGAVHQLVNVERIAFADATLALDIDGGAGQAYRLYQAAFNRTPDGGGLGFWIAAMDKGQTLAAVAQSFINSNEFKQVYGASPTNLQLVTRFYENILHRTPEADGLAFWSRALDSGAATAAGVLAGISESAENKAALIGVIGNGFGFTPYEG